MDRIVSFLSERLKAPSSLNNYLAGLAAVSLIGVPATYIMYDRYMCSRMKKKMAARAQKSNSNMEELRRDLGKHSAIVDESLVQRSFQDLQTGLQNGTISASAVLRSYQAKALEVNDEINAITDVIKDAKTLAASLDALDSSQRGPLHGVPISLKESCGVKGLDCTAGFGEMIDIPMNQDAVLVQVLKSKGAVPFIRTNLPQGMRSFACSNPIYGETCNPYAPDRSPGGSSGGEGAIIGGRGSILGVGSDIGGSIRIPACFCGICALKPTSGRLRPVRRRGQVPPTDGPMGRDVNALVQFMEAVLSKELFTLDPAVPPIPFRREIYEGWKPLKIGYYVYDECTRCVPAVERAVMLAKATLQRLGHTLVEIKPYKVLYAFSKILMPAFVGDDGEGYKELLKYDRSCDLMYALFKLHQKPYYMRWVQAKLKELMSYNPVGIEGMRRESLRTITDWFLKTNEAKSYRKAFTETWLEQGLDAVICPCMPCVATTTGVDGKLLASVTYTSLYNVVNFPAGTLPVTKVTKSDVDKTMDSSYYNAKTDIEKILQEDSVGTEGLPVGIQVVGLPYNEELVLRIMTELETALKSGGP
ncbi:fatty-acid amide hydrolase 1 [Plakobranchus ocellatus]|uniref:fatty acid amide hydrolase n=1 Tax=Plakobranchus ocellatus TaxID=259542 RepID=A0AAV4BJE5_9GAST|nr:fatty-acid amide hydrolase 1 [Plakobranchus ocellatus]